MNTWVLWGPKKFFLTKRRSMCIIIFTDHYSDLNYVHLKHSLTVDGHAFDTCPRQYGATVKHYYAGNKRFIDKKSRNKVNVDNQTISFCSVKDHFQNGRAGIYKNRQEQYCYTPSIDSQKHLRPTSGSMHCTITMKLATIYQGYHPINNPSKYSQTPPLDPN